jgi:hypothetical protein
MCNVWSRHATTNGALKTRSERSGRASGAGIQVALCSRSFTSGYLLDTASPFGFVTFNGRKAYQTAGGQLSQPWRLLWR